MSQRKPTFFTSDFHIGHEAVIRYSNRPFKDCAEMAKAMLFLPFFIINFFLSTSKPKENTSGKQLLFIELYPLKEQSKVFRFFWRLYCDRMNKMYGSKWLYEIFAIYYRNPDHPIRVLAKDVEHEAIR